jgi:flagellar hook-associated protein 1 FlgK
MATGDTLGNAISGLLAFQRGLSVTSHNISNVNTPGYSRQRVELTARTPTAFAGGFIGNGVQTTAIQRVYDDFLTRQLQSGTSAQTGLATYHSFAARVDSLLGDPDAGLTPALQSFFAAVQTVANDPSSLAARQVLMSEAESLADRFHYLDQGLADTGRNVNTFIGSTVADINQYATAIADMNGQIVLARGQSGGQAPNDLLDQRDELVRKLSELVSASTLQQDDGSINVFIGSGQTLVVGNQTQSLVAVANEYDPTRYEIGYQAGAGTINVTSQLSGGQLGGVLAFRAEVLDPARNALGRIALAVSAQVNAQHALGQDLNGNLGANFFVPINASSPNAAASSLNSGGGAVGVTVSNPSALKTADYLLAYDGANYTVTRLTDNATIYSGAPFPATLAGEGLNLSLSGAPAAGDRFLISPTRAAAGDIGVAIGDPRLVAAAAPIRTAATVGNTGSGSIGAGTVSTVSGLPLAAGNGNMTLTFAGDNGTGVPGFVVSDGSGTIGALDYNPATESAGKNFTLPPPFAGIAFGVSGVPVAGDTFTVMDNTSGQGDNRNALLLGALPTQLKLDGGTASYTDAYGSLTAEVGTRTRSAENNAGVQKTLLDQATAARESVSGVNLDEEAANMLRFQQAYQAAAQMIGVADTLFQTLIVTLRR